MSNGDDLVPKLRERYPAMPAEHMRMIGEICAYWTAVETCVLQAICEITKIDERSMLYLGSNVPAGTRFDMLHAIGNVLKETPTTKDNGTELIRLLQPVRDAYLLRNKYAHAQVRTRGPDQDPDIHVARFAKRLSSTLSPLRWQNLRQMRMLFLMRARQ